LSKASRARGASIPPCRASRSRGAALLSPFDRLVHDRKRTVELFEFDYQLEMYKPAAKRRWGYFALPILYQGRLVGKLDAAADRTVGVLRVNAIHRDVPFSKAMSAAVTTRSGIWLAGWDWISRWRGSRSPGQVSRSPADAVPAGRRSLTPRPPAAAASAAVIVGQIRGAVRRSGTRRRSR